MTFLVDHNMKGQALLLWGTLATRGWLDLLPMTLLTFEEAGLPIDSNDRTVWRFVQERRMLLLTGNRNMTGPDSLEQAIREENTPTALPIITIANISRIDERAYRERCSSRLVENVLDIDNYLGTGRVFVP